MHSDSQPAAGLVGTHPQIRHVRRLIARYGPTRAPVLVLGETGTGKELVARALHTQSSRQRGPLEVLNCAAIPSGLAESELFGHARGAFTGSTRDYAGAFERANGGSLFLDEIGEMHAALQPKLLRVLEDGRLRRVGDDRQRCVDVRLIAATHRDLEHEAEHQRFRLDLFHRLAVCVVHLPPLRARRSDIPLLAHHFVDRINAETGAALRLSEAACSFLRQQPWPGNIRALRNAIERAATCQTDELQPQHFDAPRMPQHGRVREGLVAYANRSFDETRREIYERTLNKHRGNRTAAAAELQIPKSTFFDQLRSLKLTG